MKAVILENYSSNLGRAIRNLSVKEIDKPLPSDNEVLVKMEASTCNPSDIAFIRGMYSIKKEVPCIPGFEATGTVVETGNNIKAKKLKGKRVSCFCQDNKSGTWAEYFITKPENCIEIKSSLPIEQAACFSINPFTAYGLIEYAIAKNHKTIIQTAAAGQVGLIIQELAKIHNINTINIVRKREHIELLKTKGANHVLLLNDDNFEINLKELALNLDARISFDAVGGETTGRLFNNMPEDSEIILYGGLSGNPICNIDTLDLIFKNKTISGFNLNQWLNIKNEESFIKISNELQDMIISNKIKTLVQDKLPIDKILRGILKYIGNMSKGKIIFTS